jgi:hypothetical protein
MFSVAGSNIQTDDTHKVNLYFNFVSSDFDFDGPPPPDHTTGNHGKKTTQSGKDHEGNSFSIIETTKDYDDQAFTDTDQEEKGKMGKKKDKSAGKTMGLMMILVVILIALLAIGIVYLVRLAIKRLVMDAKDRQTMRCQPPGFSAVTQVRNFDDELLALSGLSKKEVKVQKANKTCFDDELASLGLSMTSNAPGYTSPVSGQKKNLIHDVDYFSLIFSQKPFDGHGNKYGDTVCFIC